MSFDGFRFICLFVNESPSRRSCYAIRRYPINALCKNGRGHDRSPNNRSPPTYINMCVYLNTHTYALKCIETNEKHSFGNKSVGSEKC